MGTTALATSPCTVRKSSGSMSGVYPTQLSWLAYNIRTPIVSVAVAAIGILLALICEKYCNI
jgi:hypothetical protein